MDDNWNMNGRYRVFSVDKGMWVDVEFTEDRVLVSSNTKKITLLPYEPLDTYLRRINDKMTNQAKAIEELKLKVESLSRDFVFDIEQPGEIEDESARNQH